MTGNCSTKPERLIPYGKTGAGQVLFLAVRNDRVDQDGKLQESWDFEYVEVPDFGRSTIIDRIIRSRYPQDRVEAITQNHLSGEDQGEWAQLQTWRRLAKLVADGTYLKEDLEAALGPVIPVSRIDEVEQTQLAVIEVLNEKGLVP